MVAFCCDSEKLYQRRGCVGRSLDREWALPFYIWTVGSWHIATIRSMNLHGMYKCLRIQRLFELHGLVERVSLRQIFCLLMLIGYIREAAD